MSSYIRGMKRWSRLQLISMRLLRQLRLLRHLRLLLALLAIVSLLGVTFLSHFLVPRAAERRLQGAIHSVLSYYVLHNDEVSENFLFGIMLTEGQLRASKSVDKRIENDVDKLLALCDIIIESKPRYFTAKETVKKIGESLNRLKTPKLKLNTPALLPYKLETNLIKGSPSPYNSTVCLFEAMVEGQISNKCLMQMNDADARGYTLSHQGLFYSLASTMLPFLFIQQSMQHKCEKMLCEVNYAWENGMPVRVRDLVIEEVAVCGMNKFQEFLTKPILDFILSLQRKEGCFSFTKEGPLSKCDDHLSAVSLLALTNFLYEQSEGNSIL